MSELFPDVATLLASHGIDAPEQPMSTNGFSGARHTSLVQDGRRYVLKRLQFEDDWLMQLTRDTAYREAEFAASDLPRAFPAGVAVPTIGVACDGGGRAILMRDIGDLLFREAEILPADGAGFVLRRIAELHARLWDRTLRGIAWCDPRDRITIIGPPNAGALAAGGRDVFLKGWEAFGRLAPASAVTLVRRLYDDMAPFLASLDALPQTLLHGDLKSANFGIEGDTLTLLDWAMVMRGPVAIDLGWMLAVNSSVLPWTLGDTLDRYAAHLETALGRERFVAARWPEQRAAALMVGLLLYGWGKALDAADGRPDELRWWCDGALDAARLLGL